METLAENADRSDVMKRFASAAKKIAPDVLADKIIEFGEAYASTTEKQFVPALGLVAS